MSASGIKADFLSGLAARPLLGVKQTFPGTIQMMFFFMSTRPRSLHWLPQSAPRAETSPRLSLKVSGWLDLGR